MLVFSRDLHVPLTAHSSQLLSCTLALALGESTNEQGSIVALFNSAGVLDSSTSCSDRSKAALDTSRPYTGTLHALVDI
jgi:hypothetical protein